MQDAEERTGAHETGAPRRKYRVKHPVRLDRGKRLGRGDTVLLEDETAQEFGPAVEPVAEETEAYDPYAPQKPYGLDGDPDDPDGDPDRDPDRVPEGNAPGLTPSGNPLPGGSDEEGSTPDGDPDVDDPVTPATAEASGKPVRASESARKSCRSLGVDLSDVTGTGQNGSVTKADVERHYRENKPEGTSNPEGSDQASEERAGE